MKTIALTKNHQDVSKVKELYLSAFPKDEQIPFWFLLNRTKKANIDLLAFYDQGEFVGFTYLLSKGNLTYVFYLAIAENARSKGYGSKILDMVKERSSGRVILSIESTQIEAENQLQREKRKAFYLRNEFSPLSWQLLEGKVELEVLTSGGEVQSNEYTNLVKDFSGKLLYFFFKPIILN